MKGLIIFAIVLALFGAGVGLTLVMPDPSHVSPKGLEGLDIRAEVSTAVPEGRYACFPPPLGIEGPDCR
ncbi:MAG: hypothetical protein HYV46_12890 [candidate division NC10 bacterium]|nr:hypothetical protein [candidate division NC10 bacterium]